MLESVINSVESNRLPTYPFETRWRRLDWENLELISLLPGVQHDSG